MGLTRDQARDFFLKERPIFEQLAESTAKRIRELAIGARIDCTVSHRAKDVWSFVKKAIANDIDDPWESIYDKAGVRIIVRHAGDLEVAEELIRNHFDVTWSSLDEPELDDDEDRLRYPRLHFQAKPRSPTVPGSDPPFKGYSCEIQLRTAAADLWSSMSHKLLYKPSSGLPKNVRRSLYRLLALVEVYDQEVQRAMGVLGTAPDYFVNATVDQCERIYLSFCTNSTNITLTREAISIIMTTMSPDQQARYPDVLEEFAQKERDRLQEIYDQYGPSSAAYKTGLNILVGQPESIALFERLQRNEMDLENAWRKRLPEYLLEDLQQFALD